MVEEIWVIVLGVESWGAVYLCNNHLSRKEGKKGGREWWTDGDRKGGKKEDRKKERKIFWYAYGFES